MIVECFETQVKDRIQLESYVIDFCIVDDKVYVVELNPFVSHFFHTHISFSAFQHLCMSL